MLRKTLTVIILLYASCAFAADYDQLIAKTSYTSEEKAQLAVICKDADSRSLPVELLANKIKEAMTKRVRFALLMTVMKQRVARMAEAETMIKENKISARNRKYAVQVLTEALEKGVKRSACEKLMVSVANNKLVFDETAKYFDALGKYQSDYIPGEHNADIIAACISKGVSPGRSEKMLYMFTEAVRNSTPLAVAKELILQGISENKRVDEIGESMQLKGVSKRPISDNSRRDAGNGSLNNQNRGGSEIGGDNSRHNR